jgi:hypothetical protein
MTLNDSVFHWVTWPTLIWWRFYFTRQWRWSLDLFGRWDFARLYFLFYFKIFTIDKILDSAFAFSSTFFLAGVLIFSYFLELWVVTPWFVLVSSWAKFIDHDLWGTLGWSRNFNIDIYIVSSKLKLFSHFFNRIITFVQA